jgi:uncharacterized protein
MRVLRSIAPVVLFVVGLTACSSSGGGAPPHSSAPATSSGRVTTSTEVSFTANGSRTYATLEVPAHRSGQRLAAALLIAGSGPNDRNGNDPGLNVSADTLQLLADMLARQGIMTLRFDKYGAGKTGPAPVPVQDLTISTYFRQADAAYHFLAHQPQADPAKLLVVGHSEGGMIALQVADTSAVKPAGLALLEPQDQRILNLLLIQDDEFIERLLAQGQVSGTQARSSAAAVARALSAFRADRQVSTQGMAAPIAELIQSEVVTPDLVRFQRTDDQVVPAQLAEQVRKGTQVLVTEGTRDTNVPPNTIGPLVHALKTAGTTGPGLQLIQGTDHYMHLASQPDTQAVLAAPIIAAIRQWARPFAAAH